MASLRLISAIAAVGQTVARPNWPHNPAALVRCRRRRIARGWAKSYDDACAVFWSDIDWSEKIGAVQGRVTQPVPVHGRLSAIRLTLADRYWRSRSEGTSRISRWWSRTHQGSSRRRR
jgi:hypothetical protein